jgi:hypothetical protein
MVFLSHSWFSMQELVQHMSSFNSRQSAKKQVDATGVSTVSFTDSFLKSLRPLQRSSLPIQPSFRQNVWYFLYQSLIKLFLIQWSWLQFEPLM